MIPDPFLDELDAPVPAIDPAKLPPAPARPQILKRRFVAAAFVAAYELVLLALLGTRADLAIVPWSYLLLAAALPLIGAAIALVIDDRRARFGVALVLSTFFIGQLAAGAIDWQERFATWRWMKCSGLSALLAIGPLVIAVIAFRHAFATRSRERSALLGAISAALAASILRLHCPNDLLLHVLIAHGGPVLLITLLAALILARFTRA